MSKIVSRLRISQEHELLSKLAAAGLNENLAQNVIESKNNELAKRVIACIKRSGYGVATSQELAHEIMGKNFLGIEEAILHFDIKFSKHEFQALAEIPFSEAILREYKDTHILVCVPAISILDIRRYKLLHDYLYDNWYKKEKFAKEGKQIGWQLIKKKVESKFKLKSWDDQRDLLSDNEIVPSARTMIYTLSGYYLTTGNRLFGDSLVRTSCVDENANHICIGNFDSRGIIVCEHDNKHDANYLSLALALDL